MSTRRIVYTRPDGGISVISPAPEYVAQFATEDAALTAIRAKDVPHDADNVHVCSVADLYPPSKTVAEVRRFRNCWRQAGAAVPHVDLPLARLQRMAEIRTTRNMRLAASDGPMLRVQEKGAQPEIVAMRVYRQALRDVPQTIDLSPFMTLEALMAFEPMWPKAPETP